MATAEPAAETVPETAMPEPAAETVPETPETPEAAEAPAPEALAPKEPAEAAAAQTAAPETETAPASKALDSEEPTETETVAPEIPATAETPAEQEPATPEIQPLMMEPAIIDADPEIVVPQQRTEPLPEAEAEHEQPAIPEQSTEPPAGALAHPKTPEADAAQDTAADPEDAPAPEAIARPGAEPTPEPDTKAEPETTPEPEAAAGPETIEAPETTPAPETDAEPEAASAPEAEAPDAFAPSQAAPADDASRATASETGSLTGTPSLATAQAAAAAALAHTGLTGTTAKLYLVLDRSTSMRPYYRDGSAQALADQTLALAAHLDKDQTVHVVFFSTEVDGTTDLTLTEDHATRIDETHAKLGRMGRTSYHVAVEAVLAHHDTHNAPGDDVLVVFQTDGAPDAKTPATKALADAAKTHPKVFFSFVAFGEPDNKAFDYLRRLKTGNTSFFHAGPTPRELTDTELYEGVLAGWRP
ncbi:VWA domain-containing protein [Streptomyces sp. NPDC001781]